MRPILGHICAVAALLMSSTGASASTFVAMSADEMITQAAAIVQGRVLNVEARWDDNGTIVISKARVLVNEVLAGSAPATVDVETPGGDLGDTYVEAAGFPKFRRGEEVILFLRNDGQRWRVLGHQQGHFEVVTRDDGIALAVPQLDEGVALLTRGGQRAPAAQSVELGQFKSTVRAQADRLRARD